jgi:hypothetical protein
VNDQHDPVGKSIYMMQDSLPVQKITHVSFSTVVGAVRSTSACCARSAFDSPIASGDPRPMTKSQAQHFSQDVKCGNLQKCIASTMPHTDARGTSAHAL